MKFKLVEYPYGREIGFNQDTVWFIQGTDDNKTWYIYKLSGFFYIIITNKNHQ